MQPGCGHTHRARPLAVQSCPAACQLSQSRVDAQKKTDRIVHPTVHCDGILTYSATAKNPCRTFVALSHSANLPVPSDTARIGEFSVVPKSPSEGCRRVERTEPVEHR